MTMIQFSIMGKNFFLINDIIKLIVNPSKHSSPKCVFNTAGW